MDFQVWSNLGLGVVFFILAWLGFERFCGELKEASPTRAGLARSRGSRHPLSPGRAWRRALAWKDFYFTTGGKLWVGIKLVIYGTPLVIVRCWPQKLGGPPAWDDFGIATLFIMMLFIGVELTFSAASLFRNERQGQTLSSLAMLPQGLGRVAYEKLLGVVPSLVAAGTYLVLSLPLVVGSFLKTTVSRVNDFENVFALPLLLLASQGIFFLHLVAALSLHLKRAALPLAMGIHFLIIFLWAILFTGFRGGDSGLVLLMIFGFGGAAFLHFHIGKRLAVVAAEG
jgi:hypothetical protein